MKPSQTVLLSSIAILISSFFLFDLDQFLTLTALKSQQYAIQAYYQAHPLAALSGYLLIYIVATALSLPGATILTLAGGAIFGLGWGIIIVSIASTVGATGAFLAARFLFKETVERKFSQQLQIINVGMAKNGIFYLFTLRLVPIVPFFMINLLMGLTSINTRTFFWVSQVGMLAGTAVYVNAGTQLGKIEVLADILSPALIGSFVLLGLFPLVAKKVVEAVQAKQIYQAWSKPEQFDTNLVVIGAGAGGLVSAYIAAAAKAKVTLIEKHQMGGDCLNTGCVPSKTLIKSSKLLAATAHSAEFGIKTAQVEVDFAQIMQRIQDTVTRVAEHDSVQRYSQLGVDVIQGEAKIISPWQVEVKTAEQTQVISTRAMVIATGAKPFIPSLPGLEQVDYLTSDTVWTLREKPQRLLILGGGPIGCELAQAFARLGCQVTQVEMAARLLNREDEQVSALVANKFSQEGINLRLGHTAKQILIENGEKILLADYQGQQVRIGFDQLLIAIGRVANISGYGLEELGVELSPRQTVAVNEFQATNYPNIYAVGDVCGSYQFTHIAAHQAWYAAVNALFGGVKKFRTDYSAIPFATFIEPEIARVGLNEQEAKAQGIAYEVSQYDINDLDRAIADGVDYGFVKVLTKQGSDKILGVTIVGEQAADLIAEFVLAMQHNLGLNKVLATIHIYPTLVEANKQVAGIWRRNHQPQLLLQWLKHYHDWRCKK
jgi:dihydrolipoamide dehydrogenase